MLVGNEVFLSVLCIISKLFQFLFNFFFIGSTTTFGFSIRNINTVRILPVSEDSATVLCFFFFLEGLLSLVARWESCSILLGCPSGYKGS
jgi:hypothetical protein